MIKQFKWLIMGTLAVLGLGAVLYYAQPSGTTQNENISTLDLSIEPANYDFGTISMKNGLVSKTFMVKNSQPQDIELSTIFTSCMCTTAEITINGQTYVDFGMPGHGPSKSLNQILEAGKEAEVKITFDPNAHGPSGIGIIERTVGLQSSTNETANIGIKANVTP